MRIVLVSPYSWTIPGGVNTHVAALARELRHRGHEVRIIAPAEGPVEPGVTAVGRTIGIPFNGSVARLALGPRAIARVRVALRRARADVVHIHEPFVPSVSLAALTGARAPVVATFHAAVDSRAYRAARIPFGRLRRRIVEPVAVSDAAADTVEAVFRGRPRVIPNGVECARYAAVPAVEPAARRVVFLGRLERRKGPQVLAAALPALSARVPEVTVEFAGDGPLRAQLESGIPEELRGRVSFTGRYDRAEDVLARASVVCLPAIGGESFGITLVEAMAAGRPVVASAIPGYAAVAAGGGGVRLVEPDEPDALADALADLATDDDAIRRLGEEARASARRFDWPLVAERLEAVYLEARSGSSRRAG